MDILEAIKKLIEEAGQIEPGSVVHISAKHDDNCPTLQTGNFLDCTCKPEIKKMA